MPVPAAKLKEQLKVAKETASRPLRDPYERGQYLKTQGRKREQLLKQFCKLEGPAGNSADFQRGWDLIWGKKEGARG